MSAPASSPAYLPVVPESLAYMHSHGTQVGGQNTQNNLTTAVFHFVALKAGAGHIHFTRKNCGQSSLGLNILEKVVKAPEAAKSTAAPSSPGRPQSAIPKAKAGVRPSSAKTISSSKSTSKLGSTATSTIKAAPKKTAAPKAPAAPKVVSYEMVGVNDTLTAHVGDIISVRYAYNPLTGDRIFLKSFSSDVVDISTPPSSTPAVATVADPISLAEPIRPTSAVPKKSSPAKGGAASTAKPLGASTRLGATAKSAAATPKRSAALSGTTRTTAAAGSRPSSAATKTGKAAAGSTLKKTAGPASKTGTAAPKAKAGAKAAPKAAAPAGCEFAGASYHNVYNCEVCCRLVTIGPLSVPLGVAERLNVLHHPQAYSHRDTIESKQLLEYQQLEKQFAAQHSQMNAGLVGSTAAPADTATPAEPQSAGMDPCGCLVPDAPQKLAAAPEYPHHSQQHQHQQHVYEAPMQPQVDGSYPQQHLTQEEYLAAMHYQQAMHAHVVQQQQHYHNQQQVGGMGPVAYALPPPPRAVGQQH